MVRMESDDRMTTQSTRYSNKSPEAMTLISLNASYIPEKHTPKHYSESRTVDCFFAIGAQENVVGILFTEIAQYLATQAQLPTRSS